MDLQLGDNPVRARLGLLRLIALTAYSQKGNPKDSLATGFVHYLVKPVEWKDLLELLAGGNVNWVLPETKVEPSIKTQ